MKRLILILTSILLLSLPAAHAASSGQMQASTAEHSGAQARADQIRKQCVAYISKECNLSEEEGQLLEGELVKYDRKKMALWHERVQLLDKLRKGDLSEYNYGQTLDRILEIDVELRKCRMDFYQSLRPRFGNKKIAQIYVAMRHFKRDFSRSRRGK